MGDEWAMARAQERYETPPDVPLDDDEVDQLEVELDRWHARGIDTWAEYEEYYGDPDGEW